MLHLPLIPPSANTIIMGDFNTGPGHLGGPLLSTSINTQGRILVQGMDNFNLVSTYLHQSNQLLSHTYRSDAHLSVSTRDHILCSKHLMSAIQSVFLINDHPLNSSDHFPVFVYHLPPLHYYLCRYPRSLLTVHLLPLTIWPILPRKLSTKGIQ